MKFVSIKYEIGQEVGNCVYMGGETIKLNDHGEKVRRADFKCRCGDIFHARIVDVKSGNTNSCGCWNIQVARGKMTTHGGRWTTEYKSWCGMKERCYNIKNHKYPIYGAIGIIICDRWLNSFENFISDMGPKPSSKHSIDRIDNDGNYEPSNCRWATPLEQSRNTSHNRWIEGGGENMLLVDWASRFGVDPSVVLYHLKRRTMDETIEFYKEKAKKCS